ncbi:photosynthetic reaction center cytochrome c subunit [Natronocella acetinitrilica]|uniref:Photosynthetic reaction center cytochrome c subunit n=1 Tax=Natronocella acetinitrilica TaxID=414046 RepID=A0AAE3G5M5_9GAMM|nr:photosynthetic reaction center cytochrome PufC [Natronocella acetinitrilica]MCP1675827.1 photosynthetic reaction center cytochrome c subunit [Natronocella acetinitrilica]
MMTHTIGRVMGAIALAATIALLGCERPPVDVEQIGYRGTGTQNPENPRIRERERSRHEAPEALSAAPDAGPRAGDVYENVEVLGDLSIPQFQRVMRAMTEWVSPEQGCNYCHIDGNFASEDIYTKVVSRRMLEMTRNINASWQDHVGDVGVTCYTCHRGENVPAEQWFYEEPQRFTGAGNRQMQNMPSDKTALSSLPRNAFDAYLEGDREIRVQEQDALPTGHVASIQHTEMTFSLMMHMSDALGVSCQVCHNSRAFGDWDQSPPQRTTAWHGIRMVREINNAYINSLHGVFPENRLGPTGDVGKVNCATCHQGIQQPLYGASMVQDYPSLIGDPDEDTREMQWDVMMERDPDEAVPDDDLDADDDPEFEEEGDMARVAGDQDDRIVLADRLSRFLDDME